MTQQFDFAVWRLQQRDDPAPMEKLLRQLEERTVIGQQITEVRRLLDDHAAEAGTRKGDA